MFLITIHRADRCDVNSSPPEQNGRHFTDDRFRCKFVPKGQIYNNPTLVYIVAWRRQGDKPLSELMRTGFTDAYMRHKGRLFDSQFYDKIEEIC